MIKQLKQSDVTLSPFVVTKVWELSNLYSSNLVDIQPTGSVNDLFNVAVEYIDYAIEGNLFLNRNCNVALEQQDDDTIDFEEAISGSFRYFDNADEKNSKTNTYKTILHRQIANAFYNERRNPTQIFGMENIDFPMERTNRWLADEFRVFTIPRMFFGDRIVAGSIRFDDTAVDDNVTIGDDQFGNLIVSRNIFSKIQEVRAFGNDIVSGSATASYDCPEFVQFPSPTLWAWQNGTTPQNIQVTLNAWATNAQTAIAGWKVVNVTATTFQVIFFRSDTSAALASQAIGFDWVAFK
jgi:hypothetical protein